MLKNENTSLDLMLRGFDQEHILAVTGTDVGYHGRGLREQASGIDRFAYKVAHVQERLRPTLITESLAGYAEGWPKTQVLAHLGLAGENIVTLRKLFTALGCVAEFKVADTVQRRGTMAAGMLSKHGVDNPFKLAEFQEKAEGTREEKYGAKYTLAAGSVLAEGARETFGEKMADPEFAAEVQARKVATTMGRFGVASPSQSPVVQAKIKATHQARYGVDHASQLPDSRERQSEISRKNGKTSAVKAKVTNLARYGVEHTSQLPERRSQQSSQMLDSEHQVRINAVKKLNGTFNTSSPEEKLYGLLVGYFGDDDVVRQHKDSRYPWLCDFYVPSKDLFIELNAMWTHGGHWFDVQSKHDVSIQAQWVACESKFYDAAVEQWVVRDTAKRERARDAKLNYVVFWDGKNLSDADLWFALGAPGGCDWEREYSWLPQRELSLEGMYPAEINEGPRTATKVARAANWQEFYQRELALWSSDNHPKWGTVQGHLYSNRFKYLGKLPHELTDLEILRGLSIAGMVRGWTTFDNTGMKSVLRDHSSASVYDPCAGWGERLSTAAALGVDYLGTDINPAVVAGHAEIVAHYGLTRQGTKQGDAALVDQRANSHDTVFTCPPYGATELYTEHGAENLDEDEFLAWWAQVVEFSVSPSTKVFAYQINQRLKDDMNTVLVAAGWTLTGQIAVGQGRASHFNRKSGVNAKQEFEEVQVFVR